MRAGLERSRLTGLDMEHLLASADDAGAKDAIGEIRCGMTPMVSATRIIDVIDAALWACGGLKVVDLRESELEWVSSALPRAYSTAYHAEHAGEDV